MSKSTDVFNLPFNSLSTSYHNRMWLRARANPIRLGRVLVLYLFLGPFFSLFFSLFLPSFFSVPISFSFSATFFILVLPVLMTLLSRESLPRERFAIEGCSHRLPGVFWPFNPISLLAFAPSSVPAQRLIFDKLENGTWFAKVSVENWFKLISRCWRIEIYFNALSEESVIVRYFLVSIMSLSNSIQMRN